MASKCLVFVSFVLVLILLLECIIKIDGIVYHYPRYTFKKKRDDKKYKYAKQRVEALPDCQGFLGLEHTACLRKLMSPKCYNELYGHDELEEGEIDVRFNSFKGCISQEQDNDKITMDMLTTDTYYQCKMCSKDFQHYSDLETHCQVHIKRESDWTDHVDVPKPELEPIESTIITDSNGNEDSTKLSETFITLEPVKAETLGEENVIKPLVDIPQAWTTSNLDEIINQDGGQLETSQHLNGTENFEVKIELIDEELDAIFLKEDVDQEEAFHWRNSRYDVDLDKQDDLDVKVIKGESLEKLPTECGICNRCFANRSGLFRHLREFHKGMTKEEWFTYCAQRDAAKRTRKECTICGKVIKNKGDLEKHIQNHSGIKSYQCDFCGKLFTFLQGLKIHLPTHTGYKSHKCDLCGATFRRKYDLKVHLQAHNGQKPYKCDICGKGFLREAGCMSHQKVHTGIKGYKCTVCSKAFSTAKALALHSDSSHKGIRKFQCEICGRWFTQKVHLKTHNLTHTGLKAFKCDVCHKAFSRNEHLKCHLRIHTGEKPYKCEVCHKSFAIKHYLKTHSRTHTGDKPYQCNICGMYFSQSSQQKLHTKRHESEQLSTRAKSARICSRRKKSLSC